RHEPFFCWTWTSQPASIAVFCLASCADAALQISKQAAPSRKCFLFMMVSSAREFGRAKPFCAARPTPIGGADAAHQMMNECNRESHQAFDGESSDVDACL